MSMRFLFLLLASFHICSFSSAATQSEGEASIQPGSAEANRRLAIYQADRLLREGKIDEAIEALRVITGKSEQDDPSLERLAEREVRGSIQDENSSAMASTLKRMNEDLKKIGPSESQVMIPSNAGPKVRVLVESLSKLLGGQVEVLADDQAFFDKASPEAIFVRKDFSRRVFGPPTGMPEKGPYQSLGGLKYNVGLDVLKKVFQTYGMLKDYGIKNVKVLFETRSPSVSVDCPRQADGSGTIAIKVPVKKVMVEPGSVFEELKASPPGFSSKNWWAYREMDDGSELGTSGDLPKTSAAQFVTPSRDPDVKNYYLQVTSPDPAGLEKTLMKSCARLRSDYPFSHLLHDGLLFDQMMDQFEAQRKRNEKASAQ